MFIYRIKNIINGKVYIGKTENEPNIRLYQDHRASLRNNIHINKHLQSSWNKYGESNFTFEIIEQVAFKWALNNLERFWIKTYKSHDRNFGFNKTIGGDGCRVNEETREKIRQAHLGKVLSIDHKQKLSDSHMGQTACNRKRVLCTNNGKIYESALHAAKDLGCYHSKVCSVCRGTRKSTNKLSFQYIVENAVG